MIHQRTKRKDNAEAHSARGELSVVPQVVLTPVHITTTMCV
jgi:hypothetical protein